LAINNFVAMSNQ